MIVCIFNLSTQRLRQADFSEFKPSLVFLVRPHLRKINKTSIWNLLENTYTLDL